MSISTRLPILDLDVLKTFAAIADTGNFSTAADRVLRTPSAVSMQIKKLEEILGVSLFKRDARAVSLTHHGEILLTYARRMLALNNEVVSQFIQPEMAGVVRLGAPDDIGGIVLPEVLKRFNDAFPSVMVNVMIENSETLRKAVESGELDLAIFNCSTSELRSGEEILFRDRIIWAGKKCGTAHMRTPLPVSVWESSCIWRTSAMRALENSGLDYRIAYQSGSHLAQRVAIHSDLAIAPLGPLLLEDDMVELGPEAGLPEIGDYEVGLAIGASGSEPVRAVADFVRNAIAAIGNRTEIAA
ncbi:LysR family transcriptional regulator [Rhizobium sp. L1K21]|uniref:LysR family transcriptional regulator n=1 Tax=Rhizobium sp. L1K21 TaxID=2954933 RepID=UPI0020936788|nr:LysR family transcriptional regulator [Rhizobium sp. L1K21]MCO6185770.1 LysR family transcriptional regulator [Rhizobium sp. L1K21]